MPPKKSTKAAAKPGGKSRSPSPTGKKSPKSDVEDKKSAASAKSKKSAASSGKKSPPPKKSSPKNEKSSASAKNPKSAASSKSAALARQDSVASTTRVSSPGSGGGSAVEETEEDRVRNQKQLIKKLATKTAQDEWECEDALVRTNWDYEAAKAFIGAKISHSLDSRPLDSRRNSPGPEQHGSYDDLPPPPQHASGAAGGYVPHDPRYAGAQGHNAFVQPGTQSVSPSHPYGGSQPSPPGGPYAPPQQQGSFPQQQSSFPQPQGSFPQQQNSFPQPQGSFPQQHGSFPQQQPQPQGAFPQQGNFPQQPPSLPQQPVIAGVPGFPEVGSAAAPITAEQLISAIAQQPWLVPGVLGGMAAHEKQRQQQRSETPSSATTDYEGYTTSPDADERASRHSNYNKADQQVQFSRNPSNSANRSAFSKPRFEEPHHHHQREQQQIHSAEMEVLLEKVRGIEGSLEKVFQEKEELRIQQQQQQEKQAQERRVALPEPPPPPPPLPEAPVYASPAHPAAHLRHDASALRERSRRTMLATQDLRDGGGGAAAPPPPPPPAGPPPAHRDSPGGPAKQGADPARSTQQPNAVLGGLLSSLAGVVPADRDAYGELLSRQQSLLERTRENQEQARVTHLEDELDRMKQKLMLSQKQQLQQLEVLRSIQQEVHEDRRTAEDGLQELEGVSTDINRWAEELYLRQEAHVQAKRDGLLEEAREKQRQLARAAASPGGLGAAAELADDHRDLVDRTNALARRRAQLARARDPLRQGEMNDELRGIGGRLSQAHGRSGQHEDNLAALAVAMGSTPLPPPSPARRPPSPPPPPPPPVLPDPSLQLSPPPAQQVVVQQVREENPEVLGELSTLKDVLRLMLHHQLEQSQQQEEVMARQQGLLEKQSLDEAATLNAARQNSAMLQALAQQQRQQQQEAATRERERELTRMESERRSRAAAAAALADATPARGRSSRGARRESPRASSRLARGGAAAASPGPATPQQQQQRRPRSRSAAKQREQQAPPPPPQSPGGLARRPRRTDSPMRRFAMEALEVSGAQQGSPRSQALQQSLRGISAAVGQLRDARQTYHAHQSSASPSSFAPSLADGSHPRERDSPRDPPSRRGSQQHLLPQSKSLALPAPTEPKPPQAPAPAAAAAGPNPLAKILRRFYERHNPTKMDEVDDLIEKFSGRYNTLFHALAKKYNIKASPYRDRLVGFYAKYNPDFLCAVDIILHLVEGSEEKILRELEEKYTKGKE